jgi:dihydroxy-acid dehydratase
MATGGSTNAVLHYLAIASRPRCRGPSTTSSASARVPVLCDLKPSGKYVAVDLTARRRAAGAARCC